MTAQNLPVHVYSAQLPDGTTITRRTTRRYTHVVVGRLHGGRTYYVVGWCGSAELAEKTARKSSTPVIIPLDNPRPKDAPPPPPTPAPFGNLAKRLLDPIAGESFRYVCNDGRILNDMDHVVGCVRRCVLAALIVRRDVVRESVLLSAPFRSVKVWMLNVNTPHESFTAQLERENLREVRRDVRAEHNGHDTPAFAREDFGVTNADFLR